MNFFRKANNFFENVPSYFYLALFLGYFFLRNILMPLAYDDYAYAFVWDGEHGGNLDAMSDDGQRKRVESFSDIIRSQWSHYMTWGGRVFGHGLAQFFICIGKSYFDVANTIVLAVLVVVIFKLANLSVRNSKAEIVWIFLCLFFIGARFGETFIWSTWLTGACNYFWLTVLQLIFLLPFAKALRGEKVNLPLKFCLPILAVIAGWGTEAGSVATVFLSAIFILLAWRKKFFQSWMATSFCALIVGAAANIFSPGNAEQLKFVQSVNPSAFSYTSQLFVEHFLHGFLPVAAIGLFVLLPAMIYFFRAGFKILDAESWAFAAASFIVPLSMMFSPKFELRVTIVSMMFAFVAAVTTLNKLKNSALFDRLKNFLSPVIFLVLILYSSSVLYEYFHLNKYIDAQENFISQNQAAEVIKIPPLEPLNPVLKKINGKDSPPIPYFGGVNDNEKSYMNILIAQYYGVKKIVAVP